MVKCRRMLFPRRHQVAGTLILCICVGTLLISACRKTPVYSTTPTANSSAPTSTSPASSQSPANAPIEVSISSHDEEYLVSVQWQSLPAKSILVINLYASPKNSTEPFSFAWGTGMGPPPLPDFVFAHRTSSVTGSLQFRVKSVFALPAYLHRCVRVASTPTLTVRTYNLGPETYKGSIRQPPLIKTQSLGWADLPESGMVWISPDHTVIALVPAAVPRGSFGERYVAECESSTNFDWVSRAMPSMP